MREIFRILVALLILAGFLGLIWLFYEFGLLYGTFLFYIFILILIIIGIALSLTFGLFKWIKTGKR